MKLVSLRARKTASLILLTTATPSGESLNTGQGDIRNCASDEESCGSGERS
jgi:hypothetical protein